MAWKAATLAQLLQRSAPGLNVTAEIRPSEQIKAWSLVSGKERTFRALIEQHSDIHNVRSISQVRVVDPSQTVATIIYQSASDIPVVDQAVAVELTQVFGVDQVEGTSGAFYFDTATNYLYISLPTGKNPFNCAVFVGFWLYFWPGGIEAGAEMTDHQGNVFWPYLQRVPDISKNLSSPLYGVVQKGGGSLVLASTSGNLDYMFDEYTWDQADIVFRIGGEAVPYIQWQTYRGFMVQKSSWDDNNLTLEVIDLAHSLDEQIPKTKYTAADGTASLVYWLGGNTSSNSVTKAPTGIEASAATTRVPVKMPKPIAYGTQVGFSPVPLALSDSEGIYCLTHHPNYVITSVTIGAETVGSTGSGSTFKWYALADLSQIYIVRQVTTLVVSQAQVKVTFSGKKNSDGSLMNSPADVVADLVSVEAGLNTELDSSILDRSRFLCNLYQVRVPILSMTTLRAILTTMCMSTLSNFYVTDAGAFAFSTWAPSLEGEVDLDEAWGEWVDEPKVTRDAGELYQSVFVDYDYDGLTGKYSQIQVSRPECAGRVLDRTVPFLLSNTYLATEAAAYIAGTRAARYCGSSAKTVEGTSRLRPLQYDIGKKLKAVRERLPMARGRSLHSSLVSLLRSFYDFNVRLTMDDQHIVGTQGFMAPSGDLDWDDATVDQKDIYGYWTRYDGTITDDPASYGRSRWF